MPHLKPNRPDTDITQNFNDGILKIISEVDTASPGYMPVISETVVISLRYEERTLGVSRYYNALQNQIKIKKVVRIPKTQIEITTQNSVKIGNNKYRIDLIQSVSGVYPQCIDLTLIDYER